MHASHEQIVIQLERSSLRQSTLFCLWNWLMTTENKCICDVYEQRLWPLCAEYIRVALGLQTVPWVGVAMVAIATSLEQLKNKKHLKNVGPIRHCEPLHCHSPGVAIVARRLRIDVHNDDDNNDNDNAWQRRPLWPHRMGPTNVRLIVCTNCLLILKIW